MPAINTKTALVKIVAYNGNYRVATWYSMPFYEKKLKGNKTEIAKNMINRLKNKVNFTYLLVFDNVTGNRIEL